MRLNAEKLNLLNLLKDTIPLLCKNSLQFSKGFVIDALIGITTDDASTFLLKLEETVGDVSDDNTGAVDDSEGDSAHRMRCRSSRKRPLDGGTCNKPSKQNRLDDDGSEISIDNYDENDDTDFGNESGDDDGAINDDAADANDNVDNASNDNSIGCNLVNGEAINNKKSCDNVGNENKKSDNPIDENTNDDNDDDEAMNDSNDVDRSTNDNGCVNSNEGRQHGRQSDCSEESAGIDCCKTDDDYDDRTNDERDEQLSDDTDVIVKSERFDQVDDAASDNTIHDNTVTDVSGLDDGAHDGALTRSQSSATNDPNVSGSQQVRRLLLLTTAGLVEAPVTRQACRVFVVAAASPLVT